MYMYCIVCSIVYIYIYIYTRCAVYEHTVYKVMYIYKKQFYDYINQYSIN